MNPLEAQSDETLMEMVAGGGKDALATLFRRYAPTVRNVARRVLRNDTEADGLVQDVFVFLFRKALLFKASHSSARSWIVQVTYHQAFNRRRYLNTRRYHADRDLNHVMVEPQRQSKAYFVNWSPEGDWRKESATGLWQLLSPSQLATMELHFFEGCPLEEIADRLGQELANVRRHYYHGLEKLRKAGFCWQVATKVSRTLDIDSNRELSVIHSEHNDDYFIELCALSTTGVLSGAEWHQLELHLSQCPGCKAIKAEYDCGLATTIPAMASSRSTIEDRQTPNGFSLERAEAALFEAIDREHIESDNSTASIDSPSN